MLCHIVPPAANIPDCLIALKNVYAKDDVNFLDAGCKNIAQRGIGVKKQMLAEPKKTAKPTCFSNGASAADMDPHC